MFLGLKHGTIRVEAIATRSKDATFGAPGLTTRGKKLLGTKGIAIWSKDATRGRPSLLNFSFRFEIVHSRKPSPLQTCHLEIQTGVPIVPKNLLFCGHCVIRCEFARKSPCWIAL